MNNHEMMKLSNEELVEKFRIAGREDKGVILGLLYFKNSGLIKSIANRYVGYEAIEDLMQESFFGLQTAAELYDPEKGTFSSYASIWIRQTMRRYIDCCGSCVRVPSYRKDKIYSYIKIANSYEVEFGREPTNKELAALLGVSIDEVNQIKNDKAKIRIKSLDALIPGADNDNLTLGETLATDEDIEANIIEIQDNERLKLLLWNEVAVLPEPEAQVIRKRFKDNMTMEETGTALGITDSKVRSIQARAIRKLRQSEVVDIFRSDYRYTSAYVGNGVEAFRRTWTSSTERVAMIRYKNKAKKTDRRPEEIEKEPDNIPLRAHYVPGMGF